MRVLIDMNLSPSWIETFKAEGLDALHWSAVGEPGASDHEIMRWARENGCVVFTHDLDFGALLAASGALGPSVIQVRTQDVLPAKLGQIVMGAIRDFRQELESGALISVEVDRSKVRVLPFGRQDT